MKWFIKVLRQYADFSGRARRKEYWMFALFNAIFSLAILFIFTRAFAVTGTDDTDNSKLAAVPTLASLCYFVLLLLPIMAVSVRRLHDVGKSAWWLFITLIPIIGGIWLFVLMVTEGQSGDNRYGPNPKTSTDAFDRRAQLKSAGATLTVASAGMILLMVLNLLKLSLRAWSAMPLMSYLQLVPHWLGWVLLLTAGIWLWCGKGDARTQGVPRTALYLLPLAAMLLFFLPDVSWVVLGFINNGPPSMEMLFKDPFALKSFINFWLSFGCHLLTLVFLTLRLTAARNGSSIRIAATLATVCWGIRLLWSAYFTTSGMLLTNVSGAANRLQDLVSLLRQFGQSGKLLIPVAFIVLIRTQKTECG
jgi:uncharacterized membrane protein YhaH (DUF805 family)